MRPVLYPDCLTDEQRFREIAGILAAGVLRLHARAALLPPNSEKTPNSEQDCLDVAAEIALTVHTG